MNYPRQCPYGVLASTTFLAQRCKLRQNLLADVSGSYLPSQRPTGISFPTKIGVPDGLPSGDPPRGSTVTA
jgi:hypothetical protein